MSGALDAAFVRRTYVSTSVLLGVLLLTLWVYVQVWALLPLLLGGALALGLLRVSEAIVPQIFRSGADKIVLSDDAEKKKKEMRQRLRRLLPIVLVKYLSVSLIAYFAVRLWDVRELLVFCGGFTLVQTNITMRVISRLLVSNDIHRTGEDLGKRH